MFAGGTARAVACTFESFWSGGCNKEMERGIVKMFKGLEKLFYFSQNGKYVRNDANGDKWTEIRPNANWSGLWQSKVDAAVNYGNGKVYFFRGNQYILWNVKPTRPMRTIRAPSRTIGRASNGTTSTRRSIGPAGMCSCFDAAI
ncbi:MAG: hemopexin repeat-containing protein [Rhodospirillaceae bacterium]